MSPGSARTSREGADRRAPGRPARPAARAGRTRAHAAWIWLHKWIGIATALVMILLGLTGSVIVVWKEADAWLNPRLYTPSSPAVAIGPDAALAAAQATDPAPVAALLIPDDVWPVYIALQNRDVAGRSVFFSVHVDPATGAVLGERDFFAAAINIVYFLHADLLLKPFGGHEFVGIMGFVLLFSSGTGLYLWWPRPGRFWRAVTFRWGSATPRLLLDIHNTAGFWTSVVMMVVAISGIVLVFPDASRSTIGIVSPTAGYEPPPVAAHEGPARLTAGEAVSIASTAVPGERVSSLSPPNGRSGTWRVNLTPREPGNTRGLIGSLIWIDAWTGEVLKKQNPSTMTSGDLLYRAQIGLHNGRLLGTPGRAAIFVSGLALAALAITGLWLWAYKAGARRGVARRRAERASG